MKARFTLMPVLYVALWALIAFQGSHVSAQGQRPSAEQAPSSTSASTARVELRPALDKYCVSCHNDRLKTANLTLQGGDVDLVASHPDVWEKVARKLRTHEMPPPGRPRPDASTYTALATQLETTLDNASAAHPNPGRVAVHRLNRAEYTNAVRDLLGLEVDGRALLPDDSNQESFHNIASVLSVSPALLERYLLAASQVSRLAVGTAARAAMTDTYRVPKALVQDQRTRDDLPFGSQGGTVIRHNFPVDGEYTLKVLLRRQLYYYIIGMGDPHQIEIRLDGALLKRFDIGGEAPGRGAAESFIGQNLGDPEWEYYMQNADAGLEVRVPVKAGARDVTVSFVKQYYETTGILRPAERGFARSVDELYHGHPAVDTILISGPYGAASPGDTPSRRRVFTCYPKDRGVETACAKQILSSLARRAYRRPATEKDIERLLGFYEAGRAEGGFEAGIQRGIERILAAPSFIFRIEEEPAGKAPGTVYRLNDLALASRLSFFLWSSIPDEELLDLAIRGKLSDPPTLAKQVRRMFDDPRALALVDNFATQWLSLGKLAGIVPDVDAYPEFDENLREAMQQEHRLFMESQLRGDLSVTNLVTANYTFVNERLARHYGIPNIYGDHFRRVTFDDGRRGGLLGQAGILAVTSYPNRTSPVLRGKWILANLLGAPPPPPPADVPALKDAGEEGQPRSIRERMDAHRTNPACAPCHARMDPLGFALENYDALGKWRTESDGVPVEVAARLPDGSRFEGPRGLRALLVSHSDDFVRTFTERLLSYALGRVLESSDQPAIRQIAREAAARDNQWSALIMAIVRSTPFTHAIVQDVDSDARQRAVVQRN
jgi:mono/diheme cytochrome c family protein